MKNIAIIEDEQREIDLLKNYIQQYEQTAYGRTEYNLHTFSNANLFLDEYKPHFDVILLDINLPGINGMEMAKELRLIDKKVIIIFVTSMAQFAVKGYEVDALDFIIKPISYSNFFLAFSRAMKRIDEKRERKIPIITQNYRYYLYLSDILYVEVYLRKIIFHTKEGVFETYSTLKHIESILLKEDFCKCYLSVIVNLQYVTAIKNDIIKVGNEEVPLSRRYKKQLIDALDKYVIGEE